MVSVVIWAQCSLEWPGLALCSGVTLGILSIDSTFENIKVLGGGEERRKEREESESIHAEARG